MDGFVDGYDFLLWQQGFGTIYGSFDLLLWEALYGTTPTQPGDFNSDGNVDGADFLAWQLDPSVGSLADWEANYGEVAPLSASSAAVPEPATSFILLFGVLTILFHRGLNITVMKS